MLKQLNRTANSFLYLFASFERLCIFSLGNVLICSPVVEVMKDHAEEEQEEEGSGDGDYLGFI